MNDMFEFCRENISGVHFISLALKELKIARDKLSVRSDDISPVRGTRSFHQFIPLSSNQIATKFVCNDDNTALVCNFDTNFDDALLDISPTFWVTAV